MNRIAHFDVPHQQPGLIFTSRGGSGAAFVFGHGPGGTFPDDPFPDYVPEWRPPPPRVVYPVQPPTASEEELMAHDWGHLGREVLGGLFGGGGATGSFGMPGMPPIYNVPDLTPPDMPAVVNGGGDVAAACGLPCEGMVWTGGTPPKGYKVVNFCGQGVLRKVRRRRRRRLLTASDKADISYIVATTGKGQLAASLIHRSAQ